MAIQKFICCLIVLSFSTAQSQLIAQPTLIVGITVDQMRADYIAKYWDDFDEGGFKRLVNEGFQFKNAHFNYAPTYTAPGHASIFTGCTPSSNGIIANSWYDRKLNRKVYCVEDSTALPVGTQSKAGKRSPKNLQATTLGDAVKTKADFKGKAIGISVKDRGAILPAGQMADLALWFDKSTGDFVTSSYYSEQLPEWVQATNKQLKTNGTYNLPWKLLKEESTYATLGPDDNDFEGKFKHEEKPVFPHSVPDSKRYAWATATPTGNVIVAEIAKAAINQERLGQREILDFLSVSFSSTDIVGHQFGPHSWEVKDTYLRLDKTIADLLKYLDNKVGQEAYTLFLTADHGACQTPALLASQGADAGYYKAAKWKEELEAKLGSDIILSMSNSQIFLTPRGMKSENKRTIIEYIENQQQVVAVYEKKHLLKGDFNNPVMNRLKNGIHPTKSGELIILVKPNYLDYHAYGTSHGSPYDYDTHVPLLFFGNGVESGSTDEYAEIVQIAATVCMMHNIPLPSSAWPEPLEFDD